MIENNSATAGRKRRAVLRIAMIAEKISNMRRVEMIFGNRFRKYQVWDKKESTVLK